MNSKVQEQNERSEKSWRYVHQELDEQESREFERRMGDDEALRREVAHIRQLDGRLRNLMPLTEQAEETLTDQILGEWERSTAGASSETREKIWTPFVKGLRTFFEAWRWRPYALGSLATAAATALLVVGLRAYLAGPLEWMRPEIDLGVQYRGGEPEKTISREEILKLHGALRRSVEKYYADSKGSWQGGERKWRLTTKYQELPGEGTQVRVTLYSSRQRTSVREWNRYYPNLRSFENEVDELGEQIVRELIASEPENP